jgi:hypothetical protein
MKRVLCTVLAVWLLATVGLAWALSDGDTGGVWIQSTFNQKIQVTNILSRDLGVEPATLQQCIDKVFADPNNTGKTIREAAQQCKEQEKKP